MEEVLSILASIAAIIAAVLSGVGAYKAYGYAKSAMGFRDEIIRRRSIAELSRVHTETIRILQIISNSVGPTCTKMSVRGIKPAEIARQVEEYSRFINEQSGHFDILFQNTATQLSLSLRADIEGLASSTEFEQIQQFGKAMYYKIEEFLPITKRDADEVRESL